MSYARIVMMLGVVLWLAACERPTPAPPQVQQWNQTIVPELGVKLTHPQSWKVQLGPPAADAPPGADQTFDGMHFSGVDEHSTLVGLLRSPRTQQSVKPTDVVAEMIAVHREASKSSQHNPVEDFQRQIAGCPAWVLTTSSSRTGFEMCVMTVCFVSETHEYKLAVAGEKTFFDDVRPKVMRMIDSIELIEPKKEQ